MFQPSPNCGIPARFSIDGIPISIVSSFTYVGTTVSNNSPDIEVEQRIQSATKAFGDLSTRLWSRYDIKLQTKVKVYNEAALPASLYATETMVLYGRHVKLLTRFQLHHLRSILRIKWQNKIPDVEVLNRAKSVSMEALIASAQIRWAGHVWSMLESRLL